MSRTLAWLVAVLLAGVYVLLLGWLALHQSEFDAETVQERISEIRSRPGAPLEPLPVMPTSQPVTLMMERDPFRPPSTADEL